MHNFRLVLQRMEVKQIPLIVHVVRLTALQPLDVNASFLLIYACLVLFLVMLHCMDHRCCLCLWENTSGRVQILMANQPINITMPFCIGILNITVGILEPLWEMRYVILIGQTMFYDQNCLPNRQQLEHGLTANGTTRL